MRMGLAILLLLLAGNITALCQKRHITAGLELCGLAQGRIGIDFEYGFSSHWSVRGFVSLRHECLTRVRTALEEQHDKDFPRRQPDPDTAGERHNEHMTVSFWPESPHSGLFISTGLRYGDTDGIDALTGIGYSMRIWKGLHVKAGYFVPLMQSIRNGLTNAEYITLCLCFTLK